ncbi:sporulation protein [Pontibacter sp. E15-1]|uniref:sporulation protein n=1 Tax=Pontibacter sp. E15-1 TaxID=2919918 RepID=UPI001F4F63F7|nr:sporulation protein [Pontibacter sp. E15-1]MCJ8167532.1 sporulation protein [Pontibacter sp. E15-1]
MNRILSIFLSLALLFGTACAPSSAKTSKGKSRGKTTAEARVVEDLSVYRPKYPVEDAAASDARIEPKNHVNDKVAALMDTVANVNKNIKYAQGYRILAYNGSERQTVMNLRKSIIARVPDEKDYLTYSQPNFRLKIGDFFSRIEAQQVLNQLADLLPNAQIVEEQININKTY